MSIFSIKNGKKTIPRLIYIKILIFLILVGFSAVIMQPVQSAFSLITNNIFKSLINELEEYTGLEIHYSSIRPAFSGSIDIRNLEIFDNEGELLRLSRSRFFFSIGDLLKEQKLTVYTIQIDNPAISFDTERNKDIIDLFSSFETSSGADLAGILPEDFNFKIRGGLLNFSHENISCRAENIDIDINGSDKRLSFGLKFKGEIRASGINENTLFLNANSNVSGNVSREFDDLNALILLSALTGSAETEGNYRNDIFKADEFYFNLILADDEIRAFSANREEAFKFFATYSLESGIISADIDLDNFYADDFIYFYNLPDMPKRLLRTQLNGKLNALYYGSSSFSYSAYLGGGGQKHPFSHNAALPPDTFHLDISGDENHVKIGDFCLNSGEIFSQIAFFRGIARLSGQYDFYGRNLQGNLLLDNIRAFNIENISAAFTLAGNAENISVTGESFSAADITLSDINISLNTGNMDIGLSANLAYSQDEQISISAIINPSSGFMEALMNVNSVSAVKIADTVMQFADIASLPQAVKDALENIKIDMDFFFSTDFNLMTYSAPKITIRDESPIGEFSFYGTDSVFTVNNGIFFFGENELYISANVNLANINDIGLLIDAQYMNVQWNIEGHLIDGTTLIVQDPAGLHIYGNFSNTGEISGFAEGINFPVPARQSPVILNFYTTLRFNSLDFWTVDVNFLDIAGIYTGKDFSSLSLSGVIDQDGALLNRIKYEDSLGVLEGAAEIFVDIDLPYINLSIGLQEDIIGGEAYSLKGSYNAGIIKAGLSLNNARIDRFLKDSPIASASAEAEIYWESVNSFNAGLNLTSLYIDSQETAVQSSAAVNISEKELFVNDLEIELKDFKVLLPSFRISLGEKTVSANGAIEAFLLLKDFKTDFYLTADFREIDSWLDIGIPDSFNGSLLFENLTFADLAAERFLFNFSYLEGAVSVYDGIANMIRLEMDSAGNFYAGVSDPFPIRGSVAGTFKDGIIDAYSSNFYIDMAALWNLVIVPIPDFSIDGGYIAGHLNVKGPVLNPEFYGQATGYSFSMRVPNYLPYELRPVPFEIYAEGNVMTFGPAVTVSGSGAGLAQGWFIFEDWIPKNINVDIQIPSETQIPYSLGLFGFSSEGEAYGNINVFVSLDDIYTSITGELIIDNTEMGFNVEEMNSFVESMDPEPEANIFVQFAIKTGPMVEFFWPNPSTPMIRVNTVMGSDIDVFFDSLSGQFFLTGDIDIRTGEINYLDRSFVVRQGVISFNENELDFSPTLTARAEIRDQTDTGPVTITMIVDNQPLLSFEPQFISNPALTQLEIYSILGFNVSAMQESGNPEDFQRFLISSTTDVLTQLVANTDFFGRFTFMRQFERQLRNFFRLDMVSIRTRIIQNAIVEGASGILLNPANRSNRAGNYFDNTSVFIGKYVGQDMFIQGSLNMRYDETSQLLGGISFEPEFGIEFNTPYIDIRWNIRPGNPQNLWISDNSITLSWSRSY